MTASIQFLLHHRWNTHIQLQINTWSHVLCFENIFFLLKVKKKKPTKMFTTLDTSFLQVLNFYIPGIKTKNVNIYKCVYNFDVAISKDYKLENDYN